MLQKTGISMKKIVYFIFIMFIVIAVIPMIIVRGCNAKEKQEIAEQKKDIKIKVYINQENTVKEMNLEDYVIGVVAAEMPAEFELEALKAQAVAARTYAYARLKKMYLPDDNLHNNADVCVDSTHCQAWITKEKAMEVWGSMTSVKYWNKIEEAVNETKNLIIYYEDTVINPVFHSNSGGRTENAEEVWPGDPVPYLRSVPSYGETESGEYMDTVSISSKDFISKLKSRYPDLKVNEKELMKDIEIQSYTEGQRVKAIRIGNIVLKGTEVREIYSLKSANFKIEDAGDGNLKITTIGNGHGVGMSQCGANYLAKNGGTYDEILKYYYKGVVIKSIPGM